MPRTSGAKPRYGSKRPLRQSVHGEITLRSGRTVTMDLAKPYQAHVLRFGVTSPISWMDRVNPSLLTEAMPKTLIGIWLGVLVVVWSWFLILR